jgi:membrane protease YdiL (CAAX protease family)
MADPTSLAWRVPPPPPPLPRATIGPPPPPPPPTFIFAEGDHALPGRSTEIRWRWRHLWVFGFVAFGLPEGLAAGWVTQSARVSEFLDAALYFQVIGYFLAVLLAFYMVRNIQAGDWSTLGLSWRGSVPRELLGGGAFGLVLLAAFLPIGFLLQGGEFKVDELVRLLVGSTNGLGLALASIVVVIGAPIIEEIYYRGILYEKLARRNSTLAIVVTALLFTSAHGALLIPAILLMGFALAWRRKTRSLWYTIGAHASWNLAVLVMGAFLVLGGTAFTPADGAYTASFPRSWERMEPAPIAPHPDGRVDLAMTTANGSFIGVFRMPTVKDSTRATLKKLMAFGSSSGLPALDQMPIESHPHLFDEGADSFHVAFAMDDTVASHLFVLRRPGSPDTLVFNLVCPRQACMDDGMKLDSTLHELDFPG